MPNLFIQKNYRMVNVKWMFVISFLYMASYMLNVQE